MKVLNYLKNWNLLNEKKKFASFARVGMPMDAFYAEEGAKVYVYVTPKQKILEFANREDFSKWLQSTPTEYVKGYELCAD